MQNAAVFLLAPARLGTTPDTRPGEPESPDAMSPEDSEASFDVAFDLAVPPVVAGLPVVASSSAAALPIVSLHRESGALDGGMPSPEAVDPFPEVLVLPDGSPAYFLPALDRDAVATAAEAVAEVYGGAFAHGGDGLGQGIEGHRLAGAATAETVDPVPQTAFPEDGLRQGQAVDSTVARPSIAMPSPAPTSPQPFAVPPLVAPPLSAPSGSFDKAVPIAPTGPEVVKATAAIPLRSASQVALSEEAWTSKDGTKEAPSVAVPRGTPISLAEPVILDNPVTDRAAPLASPLPGTGGTTAEAHATPLVRKDPGGPFAGAEIAAYPRQSRIARQSWPIPLALRNCGSEHFTSCRFRQKQFAKAGLSLPCRMLRPLCLSWRRHLMLALRTVQCH